MENETSFKDIGKVVIFTTKKGESFYVMENMVEEIKTEKFGTMYIIKNHDESHRIIWDWDNGVQIIVEVRKVTEFEEYSYNYIHEN